MKKRLFCLLALVLLTTACKFSQKNYIILTTDLPVNSDAVTGTRYISLKVNQEFMCYWQFIPEDIDDKIIEIKADECFEISDIDYNNKSFKAKLLYKSSYPSIKIISENCYSATTVQIRTKN